MKTNSFKFSIAFFLLIQFSYAQIPTDRLVAHYPLDGNANEMTGHCNFGLGTLALPTSDLCNTSNKALAFNGASSSIEVAVCDSLNMISEVSLSVWVKLTTFSTDTCQGNFIVGKGSDGNVGFYGLFCADNSPIAPVNDCFTLNPLDEKFTFQINFGGTPQSTSFGPPSLNTWYHIVGTYDNSQLKLYINSQIKAITNYSGNMISNNENLFIGRVGNSNGYFTNGSIDDVRIYRRALTGDEVQILYEQHCWATGVETEAQNVVKLFPNPAHESLQIEWNTFQPEKIEIIDFMGKSVLENTLGTNNLNTSIDVPNLARGMYLVKIVGKEGEYWQKFVKE